MLFAISTAFALSLSAGLSAYIPILIIGLFARYTELITLNGNYKILSSLWIIIPSAILAIVELIADKIPTIEYIWDIIQSVMRIISGAVVAGAIIYNIAPNLNISAILFGAVLASAMHSAKTTNRMSLSPSTAGFLNPFISILEDIFAVIISLLAITNKSLTLYIVIFLLIILILVSRRIINFTAFRLYVFSSLIINWFNINKGRSIYKPPIRLLKKLHITEPIRFAVKGFIINKWKRSSSWTFITDNKITISADKLIGYRISEIPMKDLNTIQFENKKITSILRFYAHQRSISIELLKNEEQIATEIVKKLRETIHK